jgi:hypothetical protein
MNVFQRLNAAREEFHTLKLNKTGHNKFAGYYYFELGDFLIPALKVFAKHGLCGAVSFTKETATMSVVNVEQPEQQINFNSPMGSAALKGCHEVQNIGAVETYQRRYLWVTALEIVEHDALDSSQPLQAKGDIKGTAAKQPALMGIGDDLPDDWKTYLENTAAEVVRLVGLGQVSEANFAMHSEPLDDVQQLYLERFLDSKTRSALRKFNSEK